MDNNLRQTCATIYSVTAKPNPSHFKNHLHNEYEILFFWQGNAEMIINSNVYKIGICFEGQLLLDDIIEANEYDIKMDMVITNHHIIENNKQFIKTKK